MFRKYITRANGVPTNHYLWFDALGAFLYNQFEFAESFFASPGNLFTISLFTIMKTRFNPKLSALLEVGVMFLPAIPAYLWVWPNISGTKLDIFQILVYVYILAGTLFIGRRRWDWNQLGINRRGIWLTLGCCIVLLVARLAIIFSFNWDVSPPQFTWLSLLGSIIYYFCLVGLVEELLFRGLVYRLLEDWRGAHWAIWGSSAGFMLWHIFGQGLLVGFATLLIGLLFALIRWRAGGIVGLIVLHALWDLEGTLLLSDSNAEILGSGSFQIASPAGVWLGTALLILVPVYLWKLHPRVEQRLSKKSP
jgi:membrane protease YdiL (CAAX protease family)